MKRRIIVTTLAGCLFLGSLISTLCLKYESLDILTTIFGVCFGLILLYFICTLVSEKQIEVYEKKIEHDILCRDPSDCDDSDRYVHIAYSYIKEPNKKYNEAENDKIHTAFLIIGAHHIFESNTKNKYRLSQLKLKTIEFYKRKKKNRFKNGFFFDKNDLFLGWGISIILGVVGTALLIIGNVVFKNTGDYSHLAGWCLSIAGGLSVIPLLVKISMVLGLK